MCTHPLFLSFPRISVAPGGCCRVGFTRAECWTVAAISCNQSPNSLNPISHGKTCIPEMSLGIGSRERQNLSEFEISGPKSDKLRKCSSLIRSLDLISTRALGAPGLSITRLISRPSFVRRYEKRKSLSRYEFLRISSHTMKCSNSLPKL